MIERCLDYGALCGFGCEAARIAGPRRDKQRRSREKTLQEEQRVTKRVYITATPTDHFVLRSDATDAGA